VVTNSPSPETVLADLVARVEQRRIEASARRGPMQRQLGQYFTPREVAERIAAHARLDGYDVLRILDPGAGVGVLAAALVARSLHEAQGRSIRVTAVEVDHTLGDALTETLRDCERTARELGTELSFEIAPEDFVAWGAAHAQASLDAVDEPSEFDVVIQNPPYGKVQRGSAVRHYLSILGVDVPNVYAAFLAMSTRLLAANGQIVAITPRSFCNGTYFRSFRRDFLHRIGLDKVSVFHERDALFADSAVLQETIVFSGTLGSRPDKVVISTARGYLDRPHERVIPYTDLVVPGDPEQFIRIPTDAEDDQNAALMAQLPATLDDLGVQVSTGRVVDFRALEFLRMEPEDDTVPLIYPHHFRNGAVVWPVPHAKKANAIQRATGSEKLLLPAGVYVLVKRLSSKEETRRVVSAVYDPQVVSADAVGFENHLNVFHARGVGMDPAVARGLSAWLSSSALDLHFRQFSGHTQVNATDLRNMRYPAKEVLAQLGRAVALDRWPEQARIDELVRQHVLKTDDEDEGEDTLSDNEASIVDRAGSFWQRSDSMPSDATRDLRLCCSLSRSSSLATTGPQRRIRCFASSKSWTSYAKSTGETTSRTLVRP
jgi:adenine-specific DNA-methyltransferase